MCLNPGVKPFFLSRCVSSHLWLWCAGGSHVWQHDKRNLGPSWRVVQSKHWTLCITKEHSAGQKHFKIYNECITFLMHPWYVYFKVPRIVYFFFIICSDGLFSFRQWCRQLMHCPLVYAMFAHLRRHLIWPQSAHYQLMSWGFWKKPFDTARWVHMYKAKLRCWEGLCLFFILQQRLLLSFFILSKSFITWDDKKTHILFVLRRARWCTVAVCPWWLTCCRAFLRMLTPSRRVSWSCSRKCPSTAAPQRKRSLILSQVQDFACSYILSSFAALVVICS